MGKLYIGLIFALLGGIIKLGIGNVDLLPPFVGYILMALAFRELSGVEAFRRCRAVAWLAALVGGAVWALALPGLRIPALSLMNRALGVYLAWMVAAGMGELEAELDEGLNAGRLKLAWMGQVAAFAVGAVTTSAGPFDFPTFFTLMMALAYLLFFNQSRKLYRSLERAGRLERAPEHEVHVDGPPDWPYEPTLQRVVNAALEAEGVDVPCVVEVSVTDDAGIRRINLDTRGIDAPTDVLSFPAFQLEPGDKPLAEWADPDTDKVYLGEMVLSLERAREQAVEYNHSLERELCYLTVHSVLHLLGYDHLDEGPMKAQMRGREETVLEHLGITRN